MYEENFEKLVDKYDKLISKVIRRVFISGYNLDDLRQECLLVLHHCNQNYDKTRGVAFITYFYTNVVNSMYDLIRKSKRSKVPSLIYVDYDDELLMKVIDTSTEESNEDDEMLVKDILIALQYIPRGNITKMIYMDGLSQREVASIENISEQRVHYLNKRNLKRLHEIFAKTV
jgi:RNA polymerase sigma factor (sigma-70 family)